LAVNFLRRKDKEKIMSHYAIDFSVYTTIYPELSAMQLKVFVMYALGFRTEPICLRLNISRNTFYTHLKQIKNKFDVSHSFELRYIYIARKDYCILKNLMG